MRLKMLHMRMTKYLIMSFMRNITTWCMEKISTICDVFHKNLLKCLSKWFWTENEQKMQKFMIQNASNSEHPICLSVEQRMTKISWKDELCCFITNLINNQSLRKKFSIHPVEQNHAATSHTTWFEESWRISVPSSDAPCLSFYLRERYQDTMISSWKDSMKRMSSQVLSTWTT